MKTTIELPDDLFIAAKKRAAELRCSGAREIWTHDRDFMSVPGLRVRYPLD